MTMPRFILLNDQLQPCQDGEQAVAELDTQQNLIIALPNGESLASGEAEVLDTTNGMGIPDSLYTALRGSDG